MQDKKVKVNLVKLKLERTEKHFSLKQLIVFALAFAVIGGYFILHSFATGQVVTTVEAENMVLPLVPDDNEHLGVRIVEDSSASGGKAVKVRKTGVSITKQFKLNSPATSVGVMVKGQDPACTTKWPNVSLAVDNKTVLSSTKIIDTSWTEYAAPSQLAAGTHNMSINMVITRDSRSPTGCIPALYVDATKFYGKTTPPPTFNYFKAQPTSVKPGGSATLSWSVKDASACQASGDWSGSKAVPAGSQSTGPLYRDSTYKLSCTGAGGTTSADPVIVTVSGGGSSSIYWGAYMDGNPTYNYYYPKNSSDHRPGCDQKSGKNCTWGDSPWDNETTLRFERNSTKNVSIIHYGQPPPWRATFDSNTGNLVIKHGSIPAIDINTSIPAKGRNTVVTDQEIADGLYDAQITAWFSAAKNWGHPFFFLPDVEMNGTWEDYSPGKNGNTAASFVAMWKHLHDLADKAGASNVTWVWCPNIDTKDQWAHYKDIYPGDAYVDWTGLDGFNFGSSSVSFDSLYQPSYNRVLTVAPTKPLLISQVSSIEYDRGVKAAWITDVLDTQLPVNYPKIKAFVWFNWWHQTQHPNLPIESSSETQAAFAAAIANPYYASNNYGNLPPLTKVQPL